jgi:hypothetical protein
MMNQPLRRVDPLGRSAPSALHHSIHAYLDQLATGSIWPIAGGSREAIVDTRRYTVGVIPKRPWNSWQTRSVPGGSLDVSLGGQGALSDPLRKHQTCVLAADEYRSSARTWKENLCSSKVIACRIVPNNGKFSRS